MQTNMPNGSQKSRTILIVVLCCIRRLCSTVLRSWGSPSAASDSGGTRGYVLDSEQWKTCGRLDRHCTITTRHMQVTDPAERWNDCTSTRCRKPGERNA